MILRGFIKRCQEYHGRTCENCIWRDDFEDCIREMIDDYNDTVPRELEIIIANKYTIEE